MQSLMLRNNWNYTILDVRCVPRDQWKVTISCLLFTRNFSKTSKNRLNELNSWRIDFSLHSNAVNILDVLLKSRYIICQCLDFVHVNFDFLWNRKAVFTIAAYLSSRSRLFTLTKVCMCSCYLFHGQILKS